EGPRARTPGPMYTYFLVIAGDLAVRAVDHLNLGVEDVREDVIAHDLLRSSFLLNLAVLNRHDVVGIAGGEVDVVEYHDDRAAEFLSGMLEVLHHFHRVRDVKVVQWLI